MRLLILICFFSTNALADVASVYVSVRATKLKSQSSFISTTVADAKYGESLIQLDKVGPWIKVKNTKNKTGYVHQSSISTNRIVLNSNAKTSRSSLLSSESIVLAGKGFNKEVENRYASKHSGLNYPAVDRMERQRVSSSEVKRFVTEGGLNKL